MQNKEIDFYVVFIELILKLNDSRTHLLPIVTTDYDHIF